MEKNQNSYDINFKRIITNKSLLCYILKTFINEYKHLEEDEILELLQHHFLEDVNSKKVLPLQQEIVDEHGKVILDTLISVRLPDNSGQIGLFIDFEMQRSVEASKSILPRAIYYVSKVIAMQKDVVFEHMDYHKLLKVYGVWICMIAENEENALNHYKTNEYHLFGEHYEDVSDYDKGEIVVMRLGAENEDIFDVLNTIFVRRGNAKEKIAYLKERYGINLEESEEEIEAMCTPEEFFEARYKYLYRKEGREEGIKEGREEGIKEGRAEGELKGKAEIIRMIMKKSNMSFDEIVIFINLPDEDKEIIQEMVCSM